MSGMLRKIHNKIKQKSIIDTQKQSNEYLKNVAILLPVNDDLHNLEAIINSLNEQQKMLLNPTNQVIYRLELFVLNLTNNSLDLGELDRKDSVKINIINYNKERYGLALIKAMHHLIDNILPDLVITIDKNLPNYATSIPKLLFHTNYYFEATVGNFVVDKPSLFDKFVGYYEFYLNRVIVGFESIENSSNVICIRRESLATVPLEEIKTLDQSFHLELNKMLEDKKVKIFNLLIKKQSQKYRKTIGTAIILAQNLIEQANFVGTAIRIKFPIINQLPLIIIALSVILVSVGSIIAASFGVISGHTLMVYFISCLSVIMIGQGIFNIYCGIYAWENPENMKGHRSPEVYTTPKMSFTALLPARNEAQVIGDTIKAVSNIDYPEELKEIIVIVRTDDLATIEAATIAIEEVRLASNKNNIKILKAHNPKNKPAKLNLALNHIKTDVVCIFDAEDRPHSELFHIVNTEMVVGKADVVQSGIQLMNYDSKWFSALNVLEYYLWFKSSLHFFAKVGTIPLGGNTVFFKTSWMRRLNGWNANCLAEDAELGQRMSMAGANIKVIYDPIHATQEETPPDMINFIKQRTRWNQGFIQVLMNGEWLKLRHLHQKLLSLYLLSWPFIQAVLFLYIPFSIITLFTFKSNVWLTILSIMPLYILIFMMISTVIAFYEFCKDYKIKFQFKHAVHILLTFIPYQFMLGIGAYRAMIRLITSQNSWEKTAHINAHSKSEVVASAN